MAESSITSCLCRADWRQSCAAPCFSPEQNSWADNPLELRTLSAQDNRLSQLRPDTRLGAARAGAQSVPLAGASRGFNIIIRMFSAPPAPAGIRRIAAPRVVVQAHRDPCSSTPAAPERKSVFEIDCAGPDAALVLE